MSPGISVSNPKRDYNSCHMYNSVVLETLSCKYLPTCRLCFSCIASLSFFSFFFPSCFKINIVSIILLWFNFHCCSQFLKNKKWFPFQKQVLVVTSKCYTRVIINLISSLKKPRISFSNFCCLHWNKYCEVPDFMHVCFKYFKYCTTIFKKCFCNLQCRGHCHTQNLAVVCLM